MASPKPFPVRSPELVAQIRVAYEAGDASVHVVATLFGIQRREIHELAKRGGWAARSVTLAAMTPCERAAARRAAARQRDLDLYGDEATIDDVRLLRSLGFGVWREGKRVRVGNQMVTLAALRAKAARERRLIGAAAVRAVVSDARV